MTMEQIEQQLAQIREEAAAGDPEHAHTEEDELFLRFIQHVAATAEGELALKAHTVLQSTHIRFPRWCA